MTRGLRSRPLIEPEAEESAAYVYEGANEVSVKSPQITEEFKAHIWQPGQSGNPGGRPKSWKTFATKLMPPEELAARIVEDCRRPDARGEEMRRWYAEQLEGKARLSVDVSTAEDDPRLLLLAAIAATLRGEKPPTLIEAAVSQESEENRTQDDISSLNPLP